jgi:hypothetical protein
MSLSLMTTGPFARRTVMRWTYFIVTVLTIGVLAIGPSGRACHAQGYVDRPVETSAVDSNLVLDKLLRRLDEQDAEIARLRYELKTALKQQTAPPLPGLGSDPSQDNTIGRATLSSGSTSSSDAMVDALSSEDFTQIGTSQTEGLNLNSYQSPFDEGLVIQSHNVAMKIGGYVKVDVIQDFNPIEDEYTFDTQTILVNAPPRKNSKIHARQSRLSFDTRWSTDSGPVRAFIEGDFFGDNNTFRLRHAYGEVKQLIVGQTWSTFANVNALPPTLDSEGSASVISRRQGQIRWTEEILIDDLTFSLAVEDPRLTVTDTIAMLNVQALTESPDVVARIRFANDRSSFQLGGVSRRLGLIDPNGNRVQGNAWGVNISGSHKFSDHDEGYVQVVFGDGIGSYKNVPDVVSDGVSQGGILPLFGWMVGWNHRWTDDLQSSVVYSENRLDSPSFQPGDELRFNSYFATNLIWTPLENYFMGIEYLYGIRQNVDLQDSEANRLQMSFGFYLP